MKKIMLILLLTCIAVKTNAEPPKLAINGASTEANYISKSLSDKKSIITAIIVSTTIVTIINTSINKQGNSNSPTGTVKP